MVSPVTSSYAQQSPIQQQSSQGTGAAEKGGAVDRAKESFEENQTRPVGSSAAESQQAETRNNGKDDQQVAELPNQNDFQSLVNQDARRGSVLDVTV
jgi:hypothetical protein